MSNAKKLHLNLNILNSGFYGSAWRAPGSEPGAAFDVQHYVRNAQIAERGLFDAIFLADTPALKDNPTYRPYQALEPTIILATIAALTKHIGLIATISTSYNEPYNIARRFATLDHASGGRIGVNLVTTADAQASWNFGLPEVLAHRERYKRAEEFADVLKALWDSWEDDAYVGDQKAARFVDVSRVHEIDHQGQFFSVRGPLNLPRGPQGHPVIVQAGGSDDGRNLAGLHAEVVFSVAQTLEDALAFSADIRRRARQAGRRDEDVVILPGLATVIGGTEEEAQKRQQELWDLVPVEYSLGRLADQLGIEPDALELDKQLPLDLPRPADRNHTMYEAAVSLARRDDLTVRQLIQRLGGGTGHRILAGTPEQIANTIEDWFRAGAADGFNLMPDVLPSGAEAFVEHVVPILQKRELFRTEYDGDTLRGRLGLARPANRFSNDSGATPMRGNANALFA